MAATNLQFVNFQLGYESYGINIMMVHSIVRYDGIREIPNSPAFVEGIYNLRGEIVPVINLHKRFNIAPRVYASEEDEYDRGMMIFKIGNDKVALIIDSVSRVVTLDSSKIQLPPSTISGIGREYIQGIYNNDDLYLVILDVGKIFDPNELRQLKLIGG